MKGSIAAVVGAFFAYLLLALGTTSGYQAVAIEEFVAAIFCAIIIGLFIGMMVPDIKKRPSMASPIRWLRLVAYIPVLFGGMVKANFDVAYRVITGKIRPAIVKISPGYKSDVAAMMLANSITLTPGTLSVDIDEESNDLYVHWINVSDQALKETKEKGVCDPSYVCGSFPKHVKAIADY